MPTAVTDPPTAEPPSDRDGMHSGVAGLAHVLAEIRLARAWTAEESALADAIATRLRATVAETTDTTYFDGLVSTIGALTALDADGAEEAVARLAELAAADGWPQTIVGPPRALPDARINDVTLGTGAVLLGALWAHRHAVPGARGLAEQAADILLAEAEEHPDRAQLAVRAAPLPGRRRRGDMPNFSHGLAGIAAALAAAGVELDRPDLVDAARRGAEHLVTLADTSDDGFAVPRRCPPARTATTTTGHLHLVPRPDRHVPAVPRPRPRRRRRRRGGAARCPGTGGCLHSVRTSGHPRAAASRASGTTTAAAAARPASATSSSTPGSALGRRRRPRVRAAPRRRARRPGAASTGTAPAGGSSSTATPSRCCRPASAGCRAPPASRRTCSAARGSAGRVGPPRPSPGWTPGGRSPTAPRRDGGRAGDRRRTPSSTSP